MIPTHPCPSIWLANLLTNEETARAKVSHTNSGIQGDYLEFVKTHLQGHLTDASGASVSFFSQINLHHNLHHPCHFVICESI